MIDFLFAFSAYPQFVEHWMDQIHDLVESVDLILKKTLIKNPDIYACVKNYYFLHPFRPPQTQNFLRL